MQNEKVQSEKCKLVEPRHESFCLTALVTRPDDGSGRFGCASHGEPGPRPAAGVLLGDLATAETHVDQLLEKPKHDKDVLELDRAMVLLTSGRPKEAEQIMRTVRNHFDEFEQKDMDSGEISPAPDRRQPPGLRGEDYEKILIRAFLALSNLMHDGGDANAYSLQITQKQEQIRERLEEERDKETEGEKKEIPAIPQVALGPYVRRCWRRRGRLDHDDVIRPDARSSRLEPGFRFRAGGGLERAEHSVNAQPGHGVVYASRAAREGADESSGVRHPDVGALLVADQIVARTSSRSCRRWRRSRSRSSSGGRTGSSARRLGRREFGWTVGDAGEHRRVRGVSSTRRRIPRWWPMPSAPAGHQEGDPGYAAERGVRSAEQCRGRHCDDAGGNGVGSDREGGYALLGCCRTRSTCSVSSCTVGTHTLRLQPAEMPRAVRAGRVGGG